MLKDLGKALADFTLASAYSASGDLKAEVGIWRVQGVDGAKLLDGFAKAVQASSTTPLTVSQPTVGGRQVEQVGAAGQLTQGPLYAFPRADMVLFVQTPDPELADEAIRSLDKG